MSVEIAECPYEGAIPHTRMLAFPTASYARRGALQRPWGTPIILRMHRMYQGDSPLDFSPARGVEYGYTPKGGDTEGTDHHDPYAHHRG